MEFTDLLIIIGAVGSIALGLERSITIRLKELEKKTEEIADTKARDLTKLLTEQIEYKLNVLSEKVADVDMNFISDVLEDIDSELLHERQAQIWRQGEREREIESKREAEEKRNAFVKRKNAVVTERDISE
jgi:hypothetical protein